LNILIEDLDEERERWKVWRERTRRIAEEIKQTGQTFPGYDAIVARGPRALTAHGANLSFRARRRPGGAKHGEESPAVSRRARSGFSRGFLTALCPIRGVAGSE
jgi:hypothetical protein